MNETAPAEDRVFGQSPTGAEDGKALRSGRLAVMLLLRDHPEGAEAQLVGCAIHHRANADEA